MYDRPGALERFIGHIRRRVIPVRRLSIATAHDGAIAIVLRVDTGRTPLSRIIAELQGLADLSAITPTADAAESTRELVLVRVRVTGDIPVIGRVLDRDADGAVIEITGAPGDIDSALRSLRESGVVHGFVRSGEIAAPPITT
jgi:acetolactate synthase small subunit